MTRNLEVVQAVLEAGRRRDTVAVLALYAPDVEWDVSRGPLAELSGAPTFHGHEGLRSFFRGWSEALEQPEYVLDEILEVGSHVVTVGRMRGRGRESGLELERAEQSGVWTVEDGLIRRVAWSRSRAEAISAAR